jgi:hypothetical protein
MRIVSSAVFSTDGVINASPNGNSSNLVVLFRTPENKALAKQMSGDLTRKSDGDPRGDWW